MRYFRLEVHDFLDSISPAVRQRLRDDACWLAPMKPDEYETVSSRIAHALIESGMRMVWNRLATHAIVRAVAGGLGMRIFEEMMLSVLLEYRPMRPTSGVEILVGSILQSRHKPEYNRNNLSHSVAAPFLTTHTQ